MKVNELRIGNWFIQYDEPEQFDGDFYHLSDIKFIQLTEEWLEKLGFRKTKGKFGNDFDMIKNKYDMYLTIEHWTDSSEISEYHNFWFCKHIIKPNKLKYVHQLQNLYFALTGEELTFKSE